MAALLLGLLAVLLAVWIGMACRRMAPPFHHLSTLSIPPAQQALYPGAPNGSRIPPSLTGALETNELLRSATRLFEDLVVGSETVALTPSGRLLMLDKYGFVHTAVSSGAGYELKHPPLYIGPGRPLGFHVVGENHLYVCDSLKGLLRVSLKSGEIELLSNAVVQGEGKATQPVHYANDLDVASDGNVYFTSATNAPVARNVEGFYDTMHSYMLSTLRGSTDGQLLKWDPRSHQTSVLASGLLFANGVALSQDETWVAVVETNLARIHRHWLRGPRTGETELLVDGLPGFPDGISRSADGGFWVALPVPLSPLMRLVSPFPFVRQVLSHLLPVLRPLVVKKWGAVLKLDAAGVPVRALYDMDGSRVASVSGATEHGDKLFLGNLAGNYVSYVHIPRLGES